MPSRFDFVLLPTWLSVSWQRLPTESILSRPSADRLHSIPSEKSSGMPAVAFVLADAEWSKLSSRVISEMCGVSNNFVSVIRSQLSSDDSSEKKIGKDGKERSLPRLNPLPNRPNKKNHRPLRN